MLLAIRKCKERMAAHDPNVRAIVYKKGLTICWVIPCEFFI